MVQQGPICCFQGTFFLRTGALVLRVRCCAAHSGGGLRPCRWQLAFKLAAAGLQSAILAATLNASDVLFCTDSTLLGVSRDHC
jgi:hypothetical protein